MNRQRLLPVNPVDPIVYHDDLRWLLGLFALLIVIAVVVGIIVVVRLLVNRPQGPLVGPTRSPALDELDLRYARGEIERDDYFARRSDLLHRPADLPPPTGPAAAP